MRYTRGNIFIFCVLSFPIFWSIYLWRAFCYLVVFQRVIVGCWVVDVLLFSKLFWQVSLLVHFLQYINGLGNIQIWCLYFWTDVHEVLTNWSYIGVMIVFYSEMLQLVLLTDSQKIYGHYHLRVKGCLLHILLLFLLPLIPLHS